MRRRTNFILFVAEDLDYEGLGCYDPFATGYTGLAASGNPFARQFQPHDRSLTPAIDGIAGRGFKATQYYCPSAICTPARYSILTGRYPERSREFCEVFPRNSQANVFFNTPISRDEDTLPKQLQRAGYRTGMAGKWHNFPQHMKLRLTDINRAIDPEADPRDPEIRRTHAAWYAQAVDYLMDGFGWDSVDRLYFDNPEPFRPRSIGCHNLEWITEGALEFLKSQADRPDPFFLYVPVTVPHERYRENIFATSNVLATPAGILDQVPEGMIPRSRLEARIREEKRPGYALEGLWLDESVKALLDALDQLGMREDTCFVFTSDHPTAGKQTCHLGRVPFMIDWAGARPGESDALLSHLDLAPTLLELAGIEETGTVGQDGRSFASLLNGEPDGFARDALLLEVVHSRALVAEGYKYIVNSSPRDLPAIGKPEETGWLCQRAYDNRERVLEVAFDADKLFPAYLEAEQLYHLEEDPLEQVNLAGSVAHQAVQDKLRLRLREELERLPHMFGLPWK